MTTAVGSASGVGMALAGGAGGATLLGGPAIAVGRRLLGSKKHTAGGRTRYAVDYADWLETGARLTGVAVVSSSATAAVDGVSNQPTQVWFYLDGGLVGEEMLVSLAMTDSLGQFKLDAAQFLVVPL